jgi:hypothetical protein
VREAKRRLDDKGAAEAECAGDFHGPASGSATARGAPPVRHDSQHVGLSVRARGGDPRRALPAGRAASRAYDDEGRSSGPCAASERMAISRACSCGYPPKWGGHPARPARTQADRHPPTHAAVNAKDASLTSASRPASRAWLAAAPASPGPPPSSRPVPWWRSTQRLTDRRSRQRSRSDRPRGAARDPA